MEAHLVVVVVIYLIFYQIIIVTFAIRNDFLVGFIREDLFVIFVFLSHTNQLLGSGVGIEIT